VDALLDAAASGVARVERDAVSVEHDARFLLVGTMNAEEGELRPQLLDRFGLGVEVVASEDRAEVVRRRLASTRIPRAWSRVTPAPRTSSAAGSSPHARGYSRCKWHNHETHQYSDGYNCRSNHKNWFVSERWYPIFFEEKFDRVSKHNEHTKRTARFGP